MNYLKSNPDGMSFQAQAVLAMLRYKLGDGIEESWDDRIKDYKAEPTVAQWFNGRELGYVVTLSSQDYKDQLHIAFAEHRSSDDIAIYVFSSPAMTNPPTIAMVPEDMEPKCFRYGEIMLAADLIIGLLRSWWVATSAKAVPA